ncbi:hypothetical protein DAPPUDRAFT_331443 [Daphnia pulex]|uniref:Uncharacterized protein n=1 Tax=Daphnia pulex TaxID=6669 RepID=E9HMI2_DAPPU|nr:hypothetical protein DAPPUDRAFT_331443 [Daphnia pulex]|eukprot:EFX67050.1 hypothetical protein DAPPUDRAFT_331443 [Daphnia pulex]
MYHSSRILDIRPYPTSEEEQTGAKIFRRVRVGYCDTTKWYRVYITKLEKFGHCEADLIPQNHLLIEGGGNEFNQNNEQNGQLTVVIADAQANNKHMECYYNIDPIGHLDLYEGIIEPQITLHDYAALF